MSRVPVGEGKLEDCQGRIGGATRRAIRQHWGLAVRRLRLVQSTPERRTGEVEEASQRGTGHPSCSGRRLRSTGGQGEGQVRNYMLQLVLPF